MRRFWLLPLAAFIAVLPFLTGGYSCGLDFSFHLQSWLGAADQLRHGVLLPRWNFFAAWNAGEPRFIFYPPLSWELGAVLTLLLPFNIVPAVLTGIVLTIAGFSMYRLTRPYASEPIALLASCFFLANPFMLWTITGRDAFAELLCAAFCPLLMAAMLSPRPTPWRIGLPLALMWLSNVPGGVLGTYLLLVLGVIRLVQAAVHIPASQPLRQRLHLLLPQAAIFTGGFAYGLALAAFFLVPANVERRYINMSNAFQPNFRPTDNLFFHRILLPWRDWFFMRTEHIAIVLAIATAVALTAAWFNARRFPRTEAAAWHQAGTPIAALAAVLLFCMTFLAKPIWRTLPALWVVQFPWRSLFILAACLGLAIALALRRIPIRRVPAALASLLLTAGLAFTVIPATHLACIGDQGPREFQARLANHRSPEPTDEYIVATGSADFLRPDNPPFWLAPTPTAYAPGTTPNPAADDPTADWPAMPDHASFSPTPLHFTVTAPGPAFLVVNLQDYPNWRILRNGTQALPHLRRPDSLLTVALPAGPSSLSIVWHHTWDEYLGGFISAGALLAFLFGHRRPHASLST